MSTLLLLLGVLLPAVAQAQTTELISHISAGDSGNYDSNGAGISANGRFVVFRSRATSDSLLQLYVYDRQSHTTEMVSVSSSGVPGNATMNLMAISGDGRYVAFDSEATNLVTGDTNGFADIFVRDRQTQTTERISLGLSGLQTNGHSGAASISSDGRYVAFESFATNVVSGDTNAAGDIFVHDRQTHTTERVNVNSSGAQSASAASWSAISADGRFVAFHSRATDLVSFNTNDEGKVFVHDRQTHTTELVSVNNAGVVANRISGPPGISADGRYVTFRSFATNLVPDDTNNEEDIFVHDRQAHTTERVNVSNSGAQTDGGYGVPGLSADGRYVVFSGWGSATLGLATGIYVYDRVTHTSRFASVTSTGENAFGSSWFRNQISADGQYVPFTSAATNVVPGVTKGTNQVYIRGPLFPPPWRLAWQNTQNGDVSYWQMNGTSLDSSGYLARAVPLAWKLVGSLDLNADGSDDFLWHNTQTGDVSYWLMNGTTRTATSGYIFRNVPLTWRPVATADLNNDGKKDIIWQNTTTGDVTYWLMNGIAIASTGYLARAVPTVWQIVAALDLNADGSPDLLWRNIQNGDLTYWFLNGTTTIGTGYVMRAVPLVWRIGGVGDIDNDGDSDLVWQNSQTGDVTYWLMNGKAISSTGYLYRGVPTAWQMRTSF